MLRRVHLVASASVARRCASSPAASAAAVTASNRTRTRAIGLVGRRSVGKTALFQLLHGARKPLAPTFAVDRREIALANEWLPKIAALYPGARVVPATCTAIDIGGIDAVADDAADGAAAWLASVLADVRLADALVHVVSCFRGADSKPVDDVAELELALVVADLDTAERAAVRRKGKLAATDLQLLDLVVAELRAGTRLAASARKLDALISSFPASAQPSAHAALASLHALTALPTVYVANVGDDFADPSSPSARAAAALVAHVRVTGETVVVVPVGLERELADAASAAEAAELRAMAGMPDGSAMEQLNARIAGALGLESFLTAGPEEVRAWTVARETRARDAAGAIHSSFRERFVRAQVCTATDVLRLGSSDACAKNGRMRSEGADYVLRDGDVVSFSVRPA